MGSVLSVFTIPASAAGDIWFVREWGTRKNPLIHHIFPIHLAILFRFRHPFVEKQVEKAKVENFGPLLGRLLRERGLSRPVDFTLGTCDTHVSMEWFTGIFAGKPDISWEDRWFPVDFPFNPLNVWVWSRKPSGSAIYSVCLAAGSS